MKMKVVKMAIGAFVLGLTIEHPQAMECDTIPWVMSEFVLGLTVEPSKAMECDSIPFPLEKLPEGLPSTILTFAAHNLEIKARCQFELISTAITVLLESGEGHEIWNLVKLWKIRPVKGVSWLDRWEGFFNFKNFQIERARYESIRKGELQGENASEDGVKRILLEYLDKACALRDPYALDGKMRIYFEGLYGFPVDIEVFEKITLEEQTLGGIPMCPDIMYLGCSDPWPLKKFEMVNTEEEDLRLDPNSVRVLREMGMNIGKSYREVVDTERNYIAVEEGVRNRDVEFLNLKLRFILEGVGGYKRDFEAARLFLTRPHCDYFWF